ncbi:alpha-L-fucosidase [Paenibacillus sp. MBLB4367]|uniref:alpha-L-fucosidase n=1 Tax=Paenibacillus sp. MBLB4367 TaxID=3384767 RepID=UPI0039082403
MAQRQEDHPIERKNASAPKPTKEQLAWADAELGVLIHFDMQVFEPGYEWRKQWGYQPSPRLFNPAQLDTDQWVRTAKAAGAQYAVLVAKHCSGFSLWPTEAHSYSVKSSPWREGGGDVVGDFVRSCKKYGLRPGLYYSTSANAYCKVDNPGLVVSGDPAEQQTYHEIVIKQVTELWTNYGELFEVWFDGGTLPPEMGGPDVRSVLLQKQPNAVCFQGPKEFPSLLRWIGNEEGTAANPCWSTTDIVSNFENHGECPLYGTGNPEGAVWAPAEADMPNRCEQWFWQPDEDHLVLPVEELVESYYHSVGCNANLLIGMVVDNRGLVPDADVKQFTAFGEHIRRRFGEPAASTSGSGREILLELNKPTVIDQLVMMEHIVDGEHILGYRIDVRSGKEWRRVAEGVSIGHKRVERFPAVEADAVRLSVTRSAGTPSIRSLAAYSAQ